MDYTQAEFDSLVCDLCNNELVGLTIEDMIKIIKSNINWQRNIYRIILLGDCPILEEYKDQLKCDLMDLDKIIA